MNSDARVNSATTGDPSGTALRVARLRAVHQLLDDPIVLDDPVALRILGSSAEAELREDPFQLNDPISRGLRAALVVRCRVAEEELTAAVTDAVRQYVVLGAGLDTFAYRNPYAKEALRVFEVDHPVTQRWKRKLLHEAGIVVPDSLTFAPVDFERTPLRQGLADADFRTDLPACFCWLGVTMYLTEDAIMQVLAFVARMPRGTSITFDFQVPASTLDPVARAIHEVMAQRVAAIGEPWISAFEPAVLRDKVLAFGFRDAKVHEPDELNRRYLFRRKDGLRTGGRLMIAKT
jgi:methyltransferase (TIGR00027 family)